MQFLLLGPVEVRDEGRSLPLPRRQQRALLAALLVRAGEVVSTDRLVDELWGEHPPASAVGSLQNAISQLRKTLGPELVRTQPPGYVLAVDPDAVDARRFERLLSESAGQEPATRAATLREALALWRGPALADLANEPWAETEAARLEELRLTALEERIEAELELGRHAALVAQLEALVAEHSLRERLWRQLALALYRSGRQAEALEACRSATSALDELGLEPSAALRQLERDILQQSTALTAPALEAEDQVAPEAGGERRVVSVLAASMPEHEDPDALRAALERVLEAANAAVGRHGGELERFGPEGLVAVFGAESSREDDALRAVRAGLELHQTAGVDVGVATGEAVVAEEPRVAGAAVARAAGLARSGSGVLLDPRTYELVRETVTAEPAGPLARVLAVATARPEGGLDAPLVGREPELARLRASFDTAREETRCVTALVTGEPGIGKTRLARELVRSLDATTLIGRCVAYGEGATFLPVVEALHGVDVRLAEDDLVERRIEGLAGAQEPGTLGESYWAIRRLLEALARARPVLLLLDDIHWAEPALLDLVEYLRDRVTDAPLLVVSLARPELLDERPGWSLDALRLEPLDEDETRELVANTAAGLEEETRERIVVLAEGNPLYAQQLAAFAAESGKALEPGAMPASIDAVLAGRLGRLEAGERATLQRAAVVGREFSRGAVAALAPPDLAVDAHLLALTRRGFVRPLPDPLPGDDAYRFHHVLVRDAAYATLTKEQRADLHERVADWLDRDGPGDDAIVGYHLEHAVLLRRDTGLRADDLARSAGERLGAAGILAWARSDGRAALGLLERARALTPPGGRRAEFDYERAIVLRSAARGDEAVLALNEAHDAARAVNDERMVVRSRLELAAMEMMNGTISPEQLLAEADDAITTLRREGDDRGLGRASLTVGIAQNLRCENRLAQEASSLALEHYRLAGFATSAAMSTYVLALFYGPTPVPDGIGECEALLQAAADRGSEANILSALGAFQGLAGRLDDARLAAERVRTMYDDLGMTLADPTGLAQLQLVVESANGCTEEAAQIARASLHELLLLGEHPWAATRAAHLAALELDLGNHDAAVAAIAVAQQHALPHDKVMELLNPAVEARILARQGDHAKAQRLARAAVAAGQETDAVLDRAQTLMALAEVLVAADEVDDAATAVREAERLLQAKGCTAGLDQLHSRFAELSAS